MLFGQAIHWYGVIIALGAALAVSLGFMREKLMGLPKDTMLDIALCTVPLGIVCARLYYVAFSWDAYRGDWLRIINIRDGGIAIYGGIIGGAIGAAIYAHIKKQSFLRLADLCAPCLLLAQGIGRWGNFINQEAYGIAVTSAAHEWFPLAVFIDATGSWHYAAFFYEFAWCVACALCLFVIERRGGIKRVGDGFFLYIMLYMAERTVVEGLRTDSLLLLGVRVSQWLSIAGMTLVPLLFARRLTQLGAILGARIHMPLCVLLGISMLLCAALGMSGWPYLVLFSVFALAHGFMLYVQLPSAQPYSQR